VGLAVDWDGEAVDALRAVLLVEVLLYGEEAGVGDGDVVSALAGVAVVEGDESELDEGVQVVGVDVVAGDVREPAVNPCVVVARPGI
jgi:hypothetical protein